MICDKCPRLCEFLEKNKAIYPDYFNAPVPNFGDKDGRFLIVGLAPGLHGANQTGRPFTKDYAGVLLYNTLLKFGWATGEYKEDINDGLQLKDAMITNAVGCVPPQNKPLPQEIKTCNERLKETIKSMENLRFLLCLGRISHEAVLSAFNLKKKDFPFAHGAMHRLPNGVTLTDSYHCSRYNTNTGRLTEQMFHNVFESIEKLR